MFLLVVLGNGAVYWLMVNLQILDSFYEVENYCGFKKQIQFASEDS